MSCYCSHYIDHFFFFSQSDHKLYLNGSLFTDFLSKLKMVTKANKGSIFDDLTFLDLVEHHVRQNQRVSRGFFGLVRLFLLFTEGPFFSILWVL